MLQTQPPFYQRLQWACDYFIVECKAVLPHVVVFLEQRIVLHRPLLKLHVDAAAIYRNHFLDSAETQILFMQVRKGESNVNSTTSAPKRL